MKRVGVAYLDDSMSGRLSLATIPMICLIMALH